MTDHDWGKVGILGCFLSFFGVEGMFFHQDFGLPLALLGIIVLVVTLFFHEPE